MKLSRIAIPAVAAALVACATTSPQPVVERLDPDTATTLTVIKTPVELIDEAPHGATGGNPYAFIAPFETDRMGTRTLYLWMSAPSIEGAKLQPQLLCDGQRLALPALDSDISHIGLSSVPYPSPVPWNTQWYFQLPRPALDCLAGAQKIALETNGTNGLPARFIVASKDLTDLKAFSSR
jgi:hypothetical protein